MSSGDAEFGFDEDFCVVHGFEHMHRLSIFDKFPRCRACDLVEHRKRLHEIAMVPFRMLTREETSVGQLAKWKCHKVVRAGRMVAMAERATGDGMRGDVMIVEDVNGANCRVTLPPGFFSRGSPVAGDYLVIYDGGAPTEYKSWSPAKTFEEGYTRITDDVEICPACGGLRPEQVKVGQAADPVDEPFTARTVERFVADCDNIFDHVEGVSDRRDVVSILLALRSRWPGLRTLLVLADGLKMLKLI